MYTCSICPPLASQLFCHTGSMASNSEFVTFVTLFLYMRMHLHDFFFSILGKFTSYNYDIDVFSKVWMLNKAWEQIASYTTLKTFVDNPKQEQLELLKHPWKEFVALSKRTKAGAKEKEQEGLMLGIESQWDRELRAWAEALEHILHIYVGYIIYIIHVVEICFPHKNIFCISSSVLKVWKVFLLKVFPMFAEISSTNTKLNFVLKNPSSIGSGSNYFLFDSIERIFRVSTHMRKFGRSHILRNYAAEKSSQSGKYGTFGHIKSVVREENEDI